MEESITGEDMRVNLRPVSSLNDLRIPRVSELYGGLRKRVNIAPRCECLRKSFLINNLRHIVSCGLWNSALNSRRNPLSLTKSRSSSALRAGFDKLLKRSALSSSVALSRNGLRI